MYHLVGPALSDVKSHFRKMAQESSTAVSPAVDSASDSGSSAPTEGDATWEPDMDTNSAVSPTARRGRVTKAPADTNKPLAKRGRGRPRKNPDAPPKPAKDPDAPKRGRGRPRKNPPSDPAEAKGKPKAAAAASDGVKRGRGRPKKNPLPEAGRGRPRKNPLPEAKTSDLEEPSFNPGNDQASAKEKEGGGGGDEPVVKRKRGRPKKATQDNEGPSTTKEPNTQPPETTEGQTEPPAKRRRGRPKKTEQKPKPKSPEPPEQPETPAKSESSDFHLEVPVSFEESSSDGEVGENIASLVSRNGILQDQQQDQQAAESSDSSYTTPDP